MTLSEMDLFYKLTPYINVNLPLLCYNPDELNIDSINPIQTVTEISNIIKIDKNYINKTINKLLRYNIIYKVEGNKSIYFVDPKLITERINNNYDYNADYVYMFVNKYDEVIYVGRTNDPYKRIYKQHFNNKSHLPKECIEESTDIYIAKLNNKNESMMYEIYYISLYKPVYNKINNQNNNSYNFDIGLDELYWHHIEVNELKESSYIFKPHTFNEITKVLNNT